MLFSERQRELLRQFTSGTSDSIEDIMDEMAVFEIVAGLKESVVLLTHPRDKKKKLNVDGMANVLKIMLSIPALKDLFKLYQSAKQHYDSIPHELSHKDYDDEDSCRSFNGVRMGGVRFINEFKRYQYWAVEEV